MESLQKFSHSDAADFPFLSSYVVGHGWALIATFISLKTQECKFYRGILGLFVISWFFIFKGPLNFSGSFYF